MNTKAEQKLYFVNAVVDFSLIGALSIVTFLLLRVFYSGARTNAVMTLAVQLSWICNWPHFAATSYRLYHSRENIQQYPLTALVVPGVVLAGVLGAFASPTVIAPYVVKLVSIWSPYHFSGQSLGISLLYARRAGVVVGKAERFALTSFIYGTFVAQTVRFETGRQHFSDSGIHYPSLGLPGWASTTAEIGMYAAGAALLMVIGRWCLLQKRIVPPIVLLPALTQYVWFVPGASWRSFNEFVPFFHSLQYLLIAWCMQLKEKMETDHMCPSPRYVLAESARWGLGNVLGGASLFYVIPHFVAVCFRVPLSFSTGVIIAGVQIHHFFVDGVIWKLKRKTVSSPLMVNITDLLGAPLALEVPAVREQRT